MSDTKGVMSNKDADRQRVRMAAPELLEALKNLVYAFDKPAWRSMPLFIEARAAIAKAEGE